MTKSHLQTGLARIHNVQHDMAHLRIYICTQEINYMILEFGNLQNG